MLVAEGHPGFQFIYHPPLPDLPDHAHFVLPFIPYFSPFFLDQHPIMQQHLLEKRLPRTQLQPKHILNVNNIRIQRQLNHPNIVQYVDG